MPDGSEEQDSEAPVRKRSRGTTDKEMKETLERWNGTGRHARGSGEQRHKELPNQDGEGKHDDDERGESHEAKNEDEARKDKKGAGCRCTNR